MFNHLRMELQVREAIAQGARLRVRAAFWTAASAVLAVAGMFIATMAAGETSDGAVLAALIAFAAATPAGVWGYWAWRDVGRRDRHIVEVVSGFAERFVASQVDAPERPGAKDGPGVVATGSVTTSRVAASNRQPLTV